MNKLELAIDAARNDDIERVIKLLEDALAEPELNLNCKSVQKRLATVWGYVKAEQAEQEPVAKRFEKMHANGDVWITTIAAAAIARNAAPVRTKDLTDDEERQVITATVEGVTTSELVMFKAVARAVIAAYKEKNK